MGTVWLFFKIVLATFTTVVMVGGVWFGAELIAAWIEKRYG